MLYSCTHVATAAVKGLILTILNAAETNTCTVRWPLQHTALLDNYRQISKKKLFTGKMYSTVTVSDRQRVKVPLHCSYCRSHQSLTDHKVSKPQLAVTRAGIEAAWSGSTRPSVGRRARPLIPTRHLNWMTAITRYTSQ